MMWSYRVWLWSYHDWNVIVSPLMGDTLVQIYITYYIYTRPLARQWYTGKTIDKIKGNRTVMSDRMSIVSESWHLWQKYWTDRGKQISTNDYRACTEVDKQWGRKVNFGSKSVIMGWRRAQDEELIFRKSRIIYKNSEHFNYLNTTVFQPSQQYVHHNYLNALDIISPLNQPDNCKIPFH